MIFWSFQRLLGVIVLCTAGLGGALSVPFLLPLHLSFFPLSSLLSPYLAAIVTSLHCFQGPLIHVNAITKSNAKCLLAFSARFLHCVALP